MRAVLTAGDHGPAADVSNLAQRGIYVPGSVSIQPITAHSPMIMPQPKSQLERSKSSFRNAVGVFAAMDVLLPALFELRRAGSDPVDFDIMATRRALEASALCRLHDDAGRDGSRGRLEIGGAGPGNALAREKLELVEVGADDADSPVLLSQGSLSRSVLEAGGGPGVCLQPLLKRWLSARSGAFLMERIDDGDLLLWVRVRDGEQEARACRIFLEHSRHRVQVHDLPLPGWT